jgi:hypothetical protein
MQQIIQTDVKYIQGINFYMFKYLKVVLLLILGYISYRVFIRILKNLGKQNGANRK